MNPYFSDPFGRSHFSMKIITFDYFTRFSRISGYQEGCYIFQRKKIYLSVRRALKMYEALVFRSYEYVKQRKQHKFNLRETGAYIYTDMTRLVYSRTHNIVLYMMWYILLYIMHDIWNTMYIYIWGGYIDEINLKKKNSRLGTDCRITLTCHYIVIILVKAAVRTRFCVPVTSELFATDG